MARAEVTMQQLELACLLQDCRRVAAKALHRNAAARSPAAGLAKQLLAACDAITDAARHAGDQASALDEQTRCLERIRAAIEAATRRND
jgi:hypothetical protein